jgi:hypothetical protein
LGEKNRFIESFSTLLARRVQKGIFAIIHGWVYHDLVQPCNPEGVLRRDLRRFAAEFERVV